MNDRNQDSDFNFFDKSVPFSLHTDCISPKDFKSKFKDYTENSFSVLQINIRSISKNFEWFKELTKL